MERVLVMSKWKNARGGGGGGGGGAGGGGGGGLDQRWLVTISKWEIHIWAFRKRTQGKSGKDRKLLL